MKIGYYTIFHRILQCENPVALSIHDDKFVYLTFPNDPWPKTRRSSNCDGDAFSNPSLVTSVTSICTSLTLVSVNLKRNRD